MACAQWRTFILNVDLVTMETVRGERTFDPMQENNLYHECGSRGLDESKARWFFQQLVLALDYCHKMNISNRDIKLENTLLHSQGADRRPMVKLCDFGTYLLCLQRDTGCSNLVYIEGASMCLSREDQILRITCRLFED